jgi:tetratricopeptide (TPR) repeat protein
MPSTTQSIAKLEKKLRKEPNSLIFFQLAEEHRKEGHLDEAVRVLKEGLSKHPNYWSARVTLGRIYHQTGNDASAREELEKVVRSVPDNLLANRLLGDIYAEMHLPGEALKRYKMVHMLTPKDADLAAQIKFLESQIPPEPALVPEPQTVAESGNGEQNLAVNNLPEFTPEVQAVDESSSGEQTLAVERETVKIEESPRRDFDEELSAPTIQMKVPDFLLKAEAPVTELFSEKIEPENETLPPADSSRIEPSDIEDRYSSPEEVLSFQDTLILDSPVEEEMEPVLQESSETKNPADELSGLADLLLSSEPGPVEAAEFDELDPEFEEDVVFEVEEEPDFEQEQFFQSSQQDSTQPIGPTDEEVEEADELTSESLAELYLSQGYVDKAVKVYERLLLNDPGNNSILQRLRELSPEEASFEAEPNSGREEVLVLEEVRRENTEREDEAARLQERRRRKIHTLENWLISIRRERH